MRAAISSDISRASRSRSIVWAVSRDSPVISWSFFVSCSMSSSRCLAFLFALGGVLALLDAALLLAQFGARRFEFAAEFFAAPERVVAGFQFGLAQNAFRVALGL